MSESAENMPGFAASIPEKRLQSFVLSSAKIGGWMHYHTHDSRRSPAGFPDLVLIRPPDLIYAELKTTKGKITEQQKTWLDALKECGAEVYVWRPQDWWDGTIDARLIAPRKLIDTLR